MDARAASIDANTPTSSGGAPAVSMPGAAGGGGRGVARDAAVDAHSPVDASPGTSRPDAHVGTAESGVPDARPPLLDAARESSPPDGPLAPDCTCPPFDYFLDITMGASLLHLTAPYALNIYCTETAVQLGHPPCGEVYRLSACNGPGFAPPCFYMGVDRSRGFLLGSFVDASGQPWDAETGAITPEPPMGRVGTGSFSATLRPRSGGDAVAVSGRFAACMTAFPACVP